MSRTPQLDPDFEREWRTWLQQPSHHTRQEVEATLGARLPQRHPVVRRLAWIGVAAGLLIGLVVLPRLVPIRPDTGAAVATPTALQTGAAVELVVIWDEEFPIDVVVRTDTKISRR